jgi:hypothetical protein
MNRLWHRLSIWLAASSLMLALVVFALTSPGKRQINTFFHRTPTGKYYVLEFVPGWIYIRRSDYTERIVSQEPSNLQSWGHDRMVAIDGIGFFPDDYPIPSGIDSGSGQSTG